MDANLTTLENDVSIRPVVDAVQQLISESNLANRNRANHTGTDQASNVIVALNGKTVEQCITEIYAALAGGGPSAPTIDTAPTISDTTPAVAQTLTVTPGTITGTTVETYFWSANGVPITATTSSTTYVVGAAYAGQVITVTQRSTVVATGLYAERTSAATAAVTATVPTNSVAPTITNSGDQVVGTTYGIASLGTWADDTSATVEYQWMLTDVDVSGATASTFSTNTGQEGKVVKVKVRKTTAQGSSVWVTSSNSSTVTGTPTLTQATAPALPATVTSGTPAVVTNATWTGGSPTLVNTRLYIDSATQPYAVGTDNPQTFSIANNQWLIDQSAITNPPGISDLTGHTLYVDQQWLLNGITYTTTKSAGEVVEPVSATLAARTDIGSYSWTQNTAVSTTRPITGTGGTGGPYTYSVSPALPSGLSMAASGAQAGYISGTPTVTDPSDTYTVTVSDGVNTPATATFTAQVSAQSVTPLSALTVTYAEASGWDVAYTGQTITGSISGANAGDGIARVQRYASGTLPITSPPAKVTYLHRTKSGDALIYSAHRSEFSWYGDNMIDLAEDVWWAFAIYPISGEWPGDTNGANDQQIFFQVHAYNPGDYSPSVALSRHGNDNSLRVGRCTTGTSVTETNLGQDSAPPAGSWTRYIIHQRMGDTLAQAPVIQVWRNETLIVDLSGSSAYNGSTAFGQNYPKCGIYFWNYTSYGATTTRAFYQSDIFMGRGASLYSQAAAAVAAFV
jgi:hypothetical protein